MLGKLHFYAGVTIVLIFVLTGQYMYHFHNHLQDMDSMNRALFRAGHLYILLFGLINVALGAYFKDAETSIFKKFQFVASIIIFTSTFLVIYGFLSELPTDQIERPLTRMSLYLILLGVAMHGIISKAFRP